MMIRTASEAKANAGQLAIIDGGARGGTLTGAWADDGETAVVEVAFKSRVVPTFTEWIDTLDVQV